MFVADAQAGEIGDGVLCDVSRACFDMAASAVRRSGMLETRMLLPQREVLLQRNWQRVAYSLGPTSSNLEVKRGGGVGLWGVMVYVCVIMQWSACSLNGRC
jgi:hypothetical protein